MLWVYMLMTFYVEVMEKNGKRRCPASIRHSGLEIANDHPSSIAVST